MKNKFILHSALWLLLALAPRAAQAQSPDDHNEGSRMTYDSPTGGLTLLLGTVG